MSPPIASETQCPRRQSALQFLLNWIDYERTQSMPCSEEALKLDRMRELLRRLGNPQDRMSIVHVAGTKGKGSTAAMIAAILSAAGRRTGLFTSPHIERLEERIVVDGQICTGDDLADLVDLVRPEVEAMARGSDLSDSPTYFEIITAMALCHFARREANTAVLEVGLGGRLDSTNVCTPCLSIITSISLDHTKQLGDTLSAIAAEKAGIIKPGVPVLSGVVDDEPREVIRRIARQNGCRLIELGVDFDFRYDPPRHLERGPALAHFDFVKPRPVVAEPTATNDQIYSLGLLGRHQAANAAIAVAAVEELRLGGWTIPEAAIERGLSRIAWPARVEVVSRRPVVVLDSAHNAASIAALVQTLDESFSARRRFLIFAASQEKDLHGMLAELVGRFDRIIFTRYLDNPRGVPPEELLSVGCVLAHTRISSPPRVCKHTPYEIAATPAEAWAAVRRITAPDDLICVTGSFFLAAEMRRQIATNPFSSHSAFDAPHGE